MKSSQSQQIPVVVAGALGKMGVEVIKAINSSSDCFLAGAVDKDTDRIGRDIGSEAGLGLMDVLVTDDLEATLCSVSQEAQRNSENIGAVLVDFTHPKVVYEHTRAAIAYGVHPVIGTTGLTTEQIIDLQQFASKASVGTAIIPNFSIGMVLLQQAAAAAASFYNFAELIELHHNQKVDAPSGTCIKTAELIEEIGKNFNKTDNKESVSLKGSRGGQRESGLRLHSIRLPGLVAHQEVMFGGPGETYTLKHDTIDRSAYMPGVLLTIRKVITLKGLIYGLEKIL